MEIKSHSNDFPSTFSQIPQIPIRSPIEIIENLHSVYNEKRIEKFRDVLDSLRSDPRFDIRDLDTIMIDAIRHDNTRFTEELLSHGLPLVPGYALEATQSKARNVLEMFFEKGWDINHPISGAQPPLLSFVYLDQEMMVWLLDRGANPNQRCEIDLTPLSYYVKYAPISNIKILLNRGGRIDQGQLLFHALERKSEVIEVLQLLLREGASLNTMMYQNHYPSWRLYYFMGLGTVLHKAAEMGNVEAVSFLVHEGIDLGKEDVNGRTALQCAKMFNKVEVVKVLEDALKH
ncbi:uncharacterized protein N7459_010034 [Penicillium hispanicum]|uniref:uncharacterized protein n=1 Tax=Penicillium hispanicum TaxID=1080232 RepID=UPI0025415CAC|nr:uncharacterized protein N7459_010034 [Penicillium hispanicum]KAJ5570604.1 hypothetical protein N7459_010034 [Penicillium hispanicum]